MYNNKTFSLVLPAFNEEMNIKKNIEAFEALKLFDEIIVIDNNSTDNTKSEIKKLQLYIILKISKVMVLQLEKGWKLAKVTIVLCEPDLNI